MTAMFQPTHIYVTAPQGRLTPIHPDDGIEPGGFPMRAKAGEASMVRYWIVQPNGHVIVSQTTRRAITRGDLIPCNDKGTPVDDVDAAQVPEGKAP
jgi:hypothetical protein